MHICLIDWGSICLLYICIVLDLAVGVAVCKTSLLNWPGKGHMKCNGIQAIYAQMTGGSICLLYIGIVLDLAVGVAVCKASVLHWLGGSICLLYICTVLDLAAGVVVCKASELNWLGMIYGAWHFCYANVFGVVVFNAHMFDWLRDPSAIFIYVLS